MYNEPYDIKTEYLKIMTGCKSLDCQKVIFETDTKLEWFFEDNQWCYFEFLCDDKDYRLISKRQKDFKEDAQIKEMSYEIRMLLSFSRFRDITTIEKDVLSRYIFKYEKAKEFDTTLTLEKFNYDLKLLEENELQNSEKTANKILAGCLGMILLAIIAFGLLVLSFFFSQKANAASKYDQDFIKNFIICKNYTQTKYNIAYNSQDTYRIKGYAPDGSGKCVYEETNQWLRGTNTTTCYFDNKQLKDYYAAMLNPDIKASVMVKGMPFVGKNEDVVYIKYFNDPKVCTTKSNRQ